MSNLTEEPFQTNVTEAPFSTQTPTLSPGVLVDVISSSDINGHLGAIDAIFIVGSILLGFAFCMIHYRRVHRERQERIRTEQNPVWMRDDEVGLDLRPSAPSHPFTLSGRINTKGKLVATAPISTYVVQT